MNYRNTQVVTFVSY